MSITENMQQVPSRGHAHRRVTALQRPLADPNVMDAVQAHIIPRLLAELTEPQQGHHTTETHAAEIEDFCRVLTSGSVERAVAHVDRLTGAGVPLERIYERHISDAARRLGALWETDELTFSEVSIGLSRLQMILRQTSPRFVAGTCARRNAPAALFSVAPGETHVLGVSIVAEHFARAGYSTRIDLTPEIDTLAEQASDPRIRIVGLSVSASRFLPQLKAAIAAIRARAAHDVLILAGGHAFQSSVGETVLTGADHIAASPQEALRLTESFLDAVVTG